MAERPDSRDETVDIDPLSAAGEPGPTVKLPEIAARSICRTLSSAGIPAGGVKLADLRDEAPLPELKLGSEKYTLLEELGRGGMGAVYLAYDHDLERRVALKTVLSEGREDLRRFFEEAQVIAQLDHPSIIPIYEIGLTDRGKPYYTMPVVRGRTLSEMLAGARSGAADAEHGFPLTRRLQAFMQICQAIAFAHERGVVHRDLKPANVMLGSHGEVQVMDWGLSKVVREGSVVTASSGSPGTASGHLVGTPCYMAPEQAAGQAVTPAVDVYALGVILYEFLTLTRPFEGDVVVVLAAILRDEPQPPRSRAPERNVPIELETVCLQALAKRSQDRPSVEELLAGVQGWIDSETDRAERHRRSEEIADEGRRKLEQYFELRAETRRLTVEVEALAQRLEGWVPAAERAESRRLEDRLRENDVRLVDLSSDLVQTLETALRFEGDNATARRLIADYYWGEFLDAEEQRDERQKTFFARRVSSYDDGRYEAELRGDGKLVLSSTPVGAEVWLSELIEVGLTPEPDAQRLIGVTPCEISPLPMGSYLAVIRKDGFRHVRYPIHIARSRVWEGSVSLYTDEEIGRGFVYVPAGLFLQGDDGKVHNTGLPRTRAHVPGFAIAEYPVTRGEYEEFLRELEQVRPDEAARRRARETPDDERQPDPTGTDTDTTSAGARVPDSLEPVVSISWHDALAYCHWRSRRDGREYRLPGEIEWEKAARGVDGRVFPWGTRFDPELCNMRWSRPRPGPVSVELFADDVSVYGVRGAAGNSRDWTATEILIGEGQAAHVDRVIRGGSWVDDQTTTRVAFRSGNAPGAARTYVGFRLALSLPPPKDGGDS